MYIYQVFLWGIDKLVYKSMKLIASAYKMMYLKVLKSTYFEDETHDLRCAEYLKTLKQNFLWIHKYWKKTPAGVWNPLQDELKKK